jgi:pyrrolidone-carboxylate peptidase
MRWVILITGLIAANAFAAESEIWKIELNGRWGLTRLILVTGFGPFAGVSDNPSGRIARPLAEEILRRCPPEDVSVSSKVLPVEPGIISKLEPQRYEKVISLGVDPNQSTHIRPEQYARNVYLGSPIDPYRPLGEVVEGPALPELPSELEGFVVAKGTKASAGEYVCNDTFYRLCRTTRHGYFIHVPFVEKQKDQRLGKALAEIACRIFDEN